jgi:hypothetical protein
MILALDLATVTGWACGNPGEQAQSGTLRFGRGGNASHGQIAAEAIAWFIEFLSEMKPGIIAYEQPLPPNFIGGKTTLNTGMVLMGLPFLLEGIAYKLGMYDVRPQRVSDIRTFFLGSNTIKSADAKQLTFERCQRLGFHPQDTNEADALALWCYQCAIVNPELAHKLTPLFGGAKL